MVQDTLNKKINNAHGLRLSSNAEDSIFTEETIWRCIVYQCITSKVSLGKIWPLLHFKEYDGIKKGRPILDDETYKEILKWTSCSSRDLLMPDEQCEQRMIELLITLLETESWYYERKESDETCKIISINLKGDKLRLCYGTYAENDDGFLVDYVPVQTQAEPKISYTLFEELFYIKNEKVKQLFFRQLGIDTREIIYNPLKKFSVGGSKELSFLDLYIMDSELFSKIQNGDFDIVFAPELMKFFEKNKPYQKNVPFNIKQKKMIDAWERFNNSRRNRTIRELNETLTKEKIEQSLLTATLSKEIQWFEVLDGVAVFQDCLKIVKVPDLENRSFLK